MVRAPVSPDSTRMPHEASTRSRTPRARPDDRQAGCHRFQDPEVRRPGPAHRYEDVAGRIRVDQALAGERPGEAHVGRHLEALGEAPERHLFRAAPDDRQRHARMCVINEGMA